MTHRMEVDDLPDWTVTSIEHPVAVGRHETKVDLILLNKALRIGVVFEFKKARSSAYWVFFRVPHASVRRDGGVITLSHVHYQPHVSQVDWNKCLWIYDDISLMSHLGVEVECHKTSSSSGPSDAPSTRGTAPLEDAFGQVSLGLNGLIGQLTRERRAAEVNERVDWLFLPSVVTTASLLRCHADIRTADVLSGTISIRPQDLATISHTVCQYPVSVSRTLDVRGSRLPKNLGAIREIELQQSVLVIQSESFSQVMKTFPWVKLRESVDNPPTGGANPFP